MRFNELCLHHKDVHSLEAFANHPDGGLLLVAEQGFGKETIARALAHLITNNKPYLISEVHVADKMSSITIDQVRELKKFFMLKTNEASENRVAVIVNAEFMTIEAQNAFLKLLEEPPERCAMILTASQIDQLLPTIRSRVITHHLRKPTSNELHMYLKKQGFPSDHTRLTNGLVGASMSIARGESNAIADSIDDAKQLLSMSTVERLKLIDQVSKDKGKTQRLLQGLKLVASGALQTAYDSGKPSDKWQRLTSTTITAQKLISENVSTKLVLTDLILNIV